METKQEIIKNFQKTQEDTGSAAVQIALLSSKIIHLTQHLATHAKDFSTKRGLLRAVGQRRRLLTYLQRTDRAEYLDLINRLGLRK